MIIILIIAGIIILTGIGLLFFLMRERNHLGVLATSKSLYQDTTEIPGKLLYAKSLPLVGKPDAFLKNGEEMIVVEYKHTKAPREPYLNHEMQLMAYCLLVEENYHVRPKGGILKYDDKEFKIVYTQKAEESVRKVVEEILEYKKNDKEPTCNHPRHNK
ncbi:MAG: CRISPR-associated protein Cas4 [Candidatus Levyibacteriota bacterium]